MSTSLLLSTVADSHPLTCGGNQAAVIGMSGRG